MEVRFDDAFTGPAAAFRFTGFVRAVEARHPEEVRDVLATVEEATTAGLWAAGWVSYEAAPAFDPALVVRAPGPPEPPLAWFGLFEDWEEAPPLPRRPYRVGTWEPSVPRETYEAAVERIREQIRAGETYQVNHTFRLTADFEGDDRSFYADLVESQRAAHCAFLDTGRWRVLSASPELFLSLEDGVLTTRPMKGTAPRGRSAQEDRARADALLASAKERAENAMIVDLLRNDMGRISEPGSVHVDELFRTERYETVWQLTSTIRSRIAPETSLLRLFGALFPSGSVTGAPKVRSMQITAQLEDSPRGVYTGAIGWIAPAGERERMAFNVAIRTVEHDAEAGRVRFGVGSGITHDSVAAREYEECLTKTRVLTERRPDFELFESIRHDEDGWLWLDEHLERMAASAAYFDFPFDQAALRKALDAAVGGFAPSPAKVRVTLARDGRVGVEVVPVAPPTTDPARLAIETELRVDSSDVFLFHKTTMRDAYTEAAARHPEADDVLFVNERGEVTETTIANLLVRIDGRWITPALDCGLLAGVHRQHLLAAGEIEEGYLSVDDVRDAGSIELISSVRMRRPARLL